MTTDIGKFDKMLIMHTKINHFFWIFHCGQVGIHCGRPGLWPTWLWL